MSKSKKSAPKSAPSTKGAKPAKSPKQAAPKKSAAPAALASAAAAPAPAAAKPAPKPEEISARAHKIWIEAGKPEGKSLDHWLQAERELSAK